MADKNPSGVPNASALSGTEEWIGTQSGNSRAITPALVDAYVRSQDGETRVTKSADQSIAVTSETDITWNQETVDDFAAHDNVTNNERLTASSAILWDVELSVQLLNLAVNGPTYELYVKRYNSSDVLQETVTAYLATNEGTQDPWKVIHAFNVSMASGDYLKASVASSDGNYDVDAGNSWFKVRTAGGGGGGGGGGNARTADPNRGKMVILRDSAHPTFTSSNDVLSFDTQDQIDDSTFHSTGTNPERVIAPWTGLYRIRMKWFTSFTTSQLITQIWFPKNRALQQGVGTPHTFFDDIPTARCDFIKDSTGSNSFGSQHVDAVVSLTANDYLQVGVFCTPNQQPNATRTYFSMEYLGPVTP